MTNPKDTALRQAREALASTTELARDLARASVFEGATVGRCIVTLDTAETALTSIDAALAGERETIDAAAERIYAIIRSKLNPFGKTWAELDEPEKSEARELADTALSAIPTPAVVRPEDVSVETIAAAIVFLAKHGIQPDIQELLVNGSPMDGTPPHTLRRLIAWAMTRRTPVSDAAVEAALNVWHRTDDWKRDQDSDDWAEMRRDMRTALEAAGKV